MATVSGSSNYVFKFRESGIVALFEETAEYIESEASRGRYWKPVDLWQDDREYRIYLEQVDSPSDIW